MLPFAYKTCQLNPCSFVHILDYEFSYPCCSCFGAENFMSGLKIVFDRERKVLGWKKFDCKHPHTYVDGSSDPMR